MITKVRQLPDGEELVLVEELGSSHRLQSDLREAAFDRRGRAIEGDRGRGAQREHRRRPISDREEV
jgi:hypothetical protein